MGQIHYHQGHINIPQMIFIEVSEIDDLHDLSVLKFALIRSKSCSLLSFGLGCKFLYSKKVSRKLLEIDKKLTAESHLLISSTVQVEGSVNVSG
jgi:hypothetical protein